MARTCRHDRTNVWKSHSYCALELNGWRIFSSMHLHNDTMRAVPLQKPGITSWVLNEVALVSITSLSRHRKRNDPRHHRLRSRYCHLNWWLTVHRLLSCLKLDKLLAIRSNMEKLGMLRQTVSECRRSTSRRWRNCKPHNKYYGQWLARALHDAPLASKWDGATEV